MAAPNSELQVAPGYRIALLVALSMILAGCGKTTSVETPQDKIQLSPNRTRPANFAQPKAAAETFFHAAASANENRIA